MGFATFGLRPALSKLQNSVGLDKLARLWPGRKLPNFHGWDTGEGRADMIMDCFAIFFDPKLNHGYFLRCHRFVRGIPGLNFMAAKMLLGLNKLKFDQFTFPKPFRCPRIDYICEFATNSVLTGMETTVEGDKASCSVLFDPVQFQLAANHSCFCFGLVRCATPPKQGPPMLKYEAGDSQNHNTKRTGFAVKDVTFLRTCRPHFLSFIVA